MNDSTSMSPPPPDPHQLEQLAAEGPWGGPAYRYRGTRIECMKGGHACGLVMEGHPLGGLTFGVVSRAGGGTLDRQPAPAGLANQLGVNAPTLPSVQTVWHCNAMPVRERGSSRTSK
jgi:hypothetical protein